MTLKTDMLYDMPAFFNVNEFAVNAVYNDGVSDIDITVLIDESSDGAGTPGVEATCYVPVASVTNPEYKQTITVSGNVWTIDQKKHGSGYQNDGLMWTLPLIRDNRSTQWRL